MVSKFPFDEASPEYLPVQIPSKNTTFSKKEESSESTLNNVPDKDFYITPRKSSPKTDPIIREEKSVIRLHAVTYGKCTNQNTGLH
jgi:hypothetical protein